MNKEIFYNELKERYKSFGKVNAAMNNEKRDNLSLSLDYIWFSATIPSEINPRICNLQTAFPSVVIDVSNQLSMSYSLGTSTNEVMQRAEKQYKSMSVLKSIEWYADLILNAYNVSIAYDKASLLYAQFNGTGRVNSSLIAEAWELLKDFTLHDRKCKLLSNAIKAALTDQ